jgi:hypothetical protein
VGDIAISSGDLTSLPTQKSPTNPFTAFKVSDHDRFSPVDFQMHSVGFPVHTAEIEVKYQNA